MLFHAQQAILPSDGWCIYRGETCVVSGLSARDAKAMAVAPVAADALVGMSGGLAMLKEAIRQGNMQQAEWLCESIEGEVGRALDKIRDRDTLTPSP